MLRNDPFPIEAARDLLGILRAMYAATPAEHARRRKHIEAIAKELQAAMDLASKTEPGTLGHTAAWNRAERVVVQLGDLMDVLTLLEPVVHAAGRRIRRIGTATRQKRPQR